MQDPNKRFVSKKRRRMAAYIVIGSTTLALAGLITASYLQTQLGRYTIQLEKGSASLSMCEDSEFESQTTILRAENMSQAYPITADMLPDDDEIDSGSGSHNGVRYNDSGEKVRDLYFAYTFYIKNISTTVADYNVLMNLITSSSTVDGTVPVERYVRARLYENLYYGEGITTSHNSQTYAKRSETTFTTDDGEVEARECISTSTKDGKTCTASKLVNAQRATEFAKSISDTSVEVCNYIYQGLAPDDTIRYTIVIWLEGYDPDCTGQIPEGASLEFSLDFSQVVNYAN